MRTATAAMLCGLAALALSACESSQDRSARLASQAKTLKRASGLRIEHRNPNVRVVRTTVLHDANGTAAVADLRNTGRRPQVGVPLSLEVDDAKGRAVYRNDAPGLDVSLTSVPLVGGGRRSFWVHNQVLSPAKPGKARVVVGAATGRAVGTPPRIELLDIHFDRDSDGISARGVVRNRSRIVQKRLTVSCVARRDRRVVAAGRAVVDKLQPHPTKKPVRFAVYFIGDPRGARLECIAPPTVLTGGAA